VDNTELDFIRLAIEQAKKSVSEDERTHPKVGVVVVKNGQVVATAFRGELAGDHAEYIAIDKKLENEVLAGATVYTTLEPCTNRNHPKVPCAERLSDRKVSRVVIGMLDPNPEISGKGQRQLRDANIVTDLFPRDFMAEVEDLNREFIRAHRHPVPPNKVDENFVLLNRERSLDDWYRAINKIYWNRNLHRDSISIFAHLIEIFGGLSVLVTEKKKPDLVAEVFVSKAIAWWMALCGKVGVKSVAAMVWAKFPYVCPYCHRCPHDPDECPEKKARQDEPDWDWLEQTGQENVQKRPESLGAWQRMFSAIYPAHQTEVHASTLARCMEELGELAEALRVFPEAPEYFLNEAADVLAWLMHIQNLIDLKRGTPKRDRGIEFETEFCKAYPDRCLDCREVPCTCPLILKTTIGRIAHKLPGGREHFMTPDKAQSAFQPKR